MLKEHLLISCSCGDTESSLVADDLVYTLEAPRILEAPPGMQNIYIYT